MPPSIKRCLHIININDLEALGWVLKKYEVACTLSKPILQNIGIVQPQPQYWQRTRELCSKHGAVLILHEAETGFATRWAAINRSAA